MIRNFTLLFLLCFGFSQALNAQTCGFDGANAALKASDPNFAKAVQQMDKDMAAWIALNGNSKSLVALYNGDTVYEVPVVVHVMHTGGAVGSIYNISDKAIEDAIDYTNGLFQANWTGIPGPGNGGTKFPVRFVLAKRTPACAATNGIVRMNASTTYANYTTDGINNPSLGGPTTGVNEFNLKALSRWPQDRYYNIWVVNRIDGVDGYSPGTFTAGYAYLPPVGATLDGTVILASQMDAGKHTLAHEMGHAWNLLHTFEDSDPSATPPTCPPNTTCSTDGDGCCDTQPHYQYGPGSCFSGQPNTCTSTNFDDNTAKNFMNYGSCADRFTPDQRTRFMATMLNFASSRSSLISSSGSVAPPVTVASTCTPSTNTPFSFLNYGPQGIIVGDANSKVYMKTISFGFGSDSRVAYRDYTCDHRLSLRAGHTYNIQVAGLANQKGVVFIDFDNDGKLGSTPAERIELPGSPYITTFTVPANAISCNALRMRVILDFTTRYIDSCSNVDNGQVEDYEVVISGGTGGGSITQAKLDTPPIGGNPSCFGTELSFKVRPTNSATTITGYRWYINGVAQAASRNKDTFNVNPADKDTIRAKVFFNGLCGTDSAMSDSIVVIRSATIPPAVAIGVVGGSNPTCLDDTVTFGIVSNVNPGGAPTYQWMSNSVNIPGATGATFKAIGRGGQNISVRMNSSSSCASPTSAVSSAVLITYGNKAPVVSIALTTGTNPGCVGQSLQFTASPVTAGGPNPTYQWVVNGTPVTGATGKTFTTATLNNNDQVRVIMTSSSSCAVPSTALSTPIIITHSQITADITIAQSAGTNPVCEGKPVMFSANTTNAGANPAYQWLINGVPAANATQPVYRTDSLRNNDIVQCILIASDPCVQNPRDTSADLTMMVTTANRPTVKIDVTWGKNPGCLDSLVELTANITDFGTSPEYTWYVNGFPIATGDMFSSSSFLDGNKITVRVNQTDGGCYIPDTVTSDVMTMVRSSTPNPPVISLIGNQLYTNFDSTFVWFGPDGEIEDATRGKAYPAKVGTYWAVTNNRGCWSSPSNRLGVTLLDITNMDISNMDVYPNPTSDKVVFDWKGTKVNYSIIVHNSVGQVVLREKAEDVSKKEISLGGFAAGNYFIMLQDAEGRVGVVKVALGQQ